MKVKFITFGCSRNQADSELMKGLVSVKHELVNNDEDVTVINTCFVKRETEKKIIKLLHKKTNKVVVAGCLSQARPQLIEAFPNNSFIGVKALMRINEAVEGHVIDLSEGEPDFCANRLLNNPLISIVPISDGCLGSCAYCCTKQARGTLRSRSINSIIKQVSQDLIRGCKEFWLTGQDTGCYGFDINSSLPELINKIISLKDDFRVRVGMMNPEHAIKILPELKESFKSNKVYDFIHLPVQSGSDKVLRSMNRNYSINDFKKILEELNHCNISTDIICGFPTETSEDWVKTINLIKEVKPSIINISRFYARPGTKAGFMKQLPSRISKERSRELSCLFNKISLANNKKLIGRKTIVLMNESGRGRTQDYRVINCEGKLGEFKQVMITNAGIHHLEGKNI